MPEADPPLAEMATAKIIRRVAEWFSPAAKRRYAEKERRMKRFMMYDLRFEIFGYWDRRSEIQKL